MTLQLSRPPVDMLDGARIAAYQQWWQLYGGAQYASATNPRDKRLVVNYLATIAQKLSAYLMYPAPQLRFSDDGAAQLWQRIAVDNQLASLDYEAALWASVLGDAAYRLGWDSIGQRVSITACDVSNLWVRTQPDDRRVVEWLAQRYYIEQADNGALGNTPDPAPLGFGNVGVNRVEVIEEWTAAEYRLWLGGQLQQRKPNPFGLIPYVIVPNTPRPGAYWGSSDFADLWPIARELNLAVSTFATIIEYSGAPVVVVENAANTDSLRVGPGQLWDLPEQSRAYLLEMMSAGGAQLYVGYLEHLQAMLRHISGLPDVAWGDVERSGGLAQSGAALALQLNPLMQGIGRRRLLWEDALRRRCHHAFAIAHRLSNAPDYGNVEIKVGWPSLTQVENTPAAKSPQWGFGGDD